MMRIVLVRWVDREVRDGCAAYETPSATQVYPFSSASLLVFFLPPLLSYSLLVTNETIRSEAVRSSMWLMRDIVTPPIFHTAIHPCGEVQYVSNHEHNGHSFYLSFILLFIDAHRYSVSKGPTWPNTKNDMGKLNQLNNTITSDFDLHFSRNDHYTQGHYGVCTPLPLRYFKITLPSRTYSFDALSLSSLIVLSWILFFFTEGFLASNILQSQPALCLCISLISYLLSLISMDGSELKSCLQPIEMTHSCFLH